MLLSNQQYDKIIQHYEKIRDHNRYVQDSHIEQAYAAIPELKMLDQERQAMISHSVARILSEATAENTTDLSKSSGNGSLKATGFQEIARRRKQLLVQAGFPEEYLEPVYLCPDCKDTGYLPSGEKCHCFLQYEAELTYDQTNMYNLLPQCDFNQLTYSYHTGEALEQLRGAVKVSLDFVSAFSKRNENPEAAYQNILFYGTVGTGKSFLSGCIGNEIIKQGGSCIYFSSSILFDTLARISFDTKAKETLYNFIKDLYNYDLVIIDDLGTELTNSFISSQFFTLLNERHNRRRSTIISTNLNLEEIRDRYSDRVFSRITSYYQLCKLVGPDVRFKQRTGL